MSRFGALTRSKVARRMVALFVLCAMLPVAGLAGAVYVQFTAALREESQQRLHQISKAVGLDLLDRLLNLESEIALLESLLATDTEALIPVAFRARLADHFTSVTLIDEEGHTRSIVGSEPSPSRTAVTGVVDLEPGRSQLIVEPQAGATPRLVLWHRPAERTGALAAEINGAFLWGGDLVPPTTEVHVLGGDRHPLFASATPERPRVPEAIQALAESSVGDLEWEQSGESYLSSYWSVPLGFTFRAPQWTVVVSELRGDVLAPMARAGTTFILVGLLSLWIVMLLSLTQVQRSLVPLGRLQDGTRRLTGGDFDQDVDVRSGDEFEELADSFNTMSHRLKRQLDMLAARGDLDRAVLSSLNVGTIIRALLDRLPRLVDCDHVAVILAAPDQSQTQVFCTSRGHSSPLETVAPAFSEDDTRTLLEVSDVLQIERGRDTPDYLAPIERTDWTACLVVPITLGGELAGLLALADDAPRVRIAQDVQVARQLADQVAVALSNARLILALDKLNVGTISALARTVDAKSPWTAGHSQRVMDMALDIGRMMDLAADRLDTIARGSLLHDIGKIAVPSAVLNKPGRLTAEEFELVKRHPQVGAHILEPISEYRHLIPIVLQHHEWFDGRGYPHAVAGDAIALEARIVAVADVFDALSSERPYRQALAFDRTVDTIRDSSGTQFDPEVVEAFLRLMQTRRADCVA